MRNVFAGVRHAAMVAVVVAITGCGSEPAEVPDPADKNYEGAEEGVTTIGMSQCSREDAWHAQMDADIKAAAAEQDDVKVIFKDAGGDSPKQVQHIEEFIDRRVDLIVISPNESQPLTEPVAKAYDVGIPVIVLDRPVIGDKYTCFIDNDNKKIGEAAARWLTENVEGPVNVVELTDRETLYRNPLHPYSQALMSAIPVPNPKVKKKRNFLKGDVPSPLNPPPGCRFHTRCPVAVDVCSVEEPVFREAEEGHWVACHLV